MRFGSTLQTAALGVALVAALNAPAPAQSGGRRPFDAVVGVIGDRVILASTIQREVEALAGDQELSEADRQRFGTEIMRRIAREEVWIQIGKVIGREDPDVFEEQVQAMLDDYKREQVANYGSFTRMTQELEANGDSWQALEEKQRNRILRDSARQHAISQRFSDGFQLLVTPREMLEFYVENQERFAARESTDLAWISFPGDRPNAEQKAADAAAAWRDEALTEKEVASRFSGVALPPNLDVRQTDDDPRAAFLKEVARDGAEGDVVGPIRRGDGFFVVKVARKVSEPERRFDDPEVQSAIRETLIRTRLIELEGGILQWKAAQIMRWPDWLLSTR